jgi:hypothetical protein
MLVSMAKMGRPKLGRGEQKGVAVSFRVNAAEKRALAAAAKAAKVPLAKWLRSTTLAAAGAS